MVEGAGGGEEEMDGRNEVGRGERKRWGRWGK